MHGKGWNTPFYANFIDFEKTFDNLHRESLWSIMRHHGIPAKFVNIIKMLYTDFSAQMICSKNLADTFEIKAGVKQSCIL